MNNEMHIRVTDKQYETYEKLKKRGYKQEHIIWEAIEIMSYTNTDEQTKTKHIHMRKRNNEQSLLFEHMLKKTGYKASDIIRIAITNLGEIHGML